MALTAIHIFTGLCMIRIGSSHQLWEWFQFQPSWYRQKGSFPHRLQPKTITNWVDVRKETYTQPAPCSKSTCLKLWSSLWPCQKHTEPCLCAVGCVPDIITVCVCVYLLSMRCKFHFALLHSGQGTCCLLLALVLGRQHIACHRLRCEGGASRWWQCVCVWYWHWLSLWVGGGL